MCINKILIYGTRNSRHDILFLSHINIHLQNQCREALCSPQASVATTTLNTGNSQTSSGWSTSWTRRATLRRRKKVFSPSAQVCMYFQVCVAIPVVRMACCWSHHDSKCTFSNVAWQWMQDRKMTVIPLILFTNFVTHAFV